MHVKSFSISLQLSKVVTENLFSPLKHISDTKLFMSQTLFELKPTQIIDLDADLNCNWTKFKKRKMLISIKLLTKYVLIIYALVFRYLKSLASESKPFQSRSKGEIPRQARQKEQLSRSIQFNSIPYFTL